MKLAYADPPYIGQAKRHYSKEELCAEVDHAELISQLMSYDGFALSMSEPTRYEIETMCRNLGAVPYRVGIWVKPFASFKPGVNPGYTFEPVIFWGGRGIGRDKPTIRDHVSANITMRKGIHGAKPLKFCYWLFEFLGAEPGDTLDDIFPGTGIVTTAWENFNKKMATHTIPMFAQVSS